MVVVPAPGADVHDLPSSVVDGPLQLAEEPRPGELPFVLDRAWRPAEDVGGLLDGQTGEEPELHDPFLVRIELREAVQRFIDGEHIGNA